MIKYSNIYECERCGKQRRITKKPKSDTICSRCGDIMGTLTVNQLKKLNIA
jgi:ribosomal protein S27E